MVTNPPFSLFREYVAQLVEHGKKFLIIGNINAITYKETVPSYQGQTKYGSAQASKAGIGNLAFPNHYPVDCRYA